MITFRSLFLPLVAAYGAGVLVSRWLVLGAFAINPSTVTATLAIAAVQAAVLGTWRGWQSRRRP